MPGASASLLADKPTRDFWTVDQRQNITCALSLQTKFRLLLLADLRNQQPPGSNVWRDFCQSQFLTPRKDWRKFS